jgi:hypothetical protein
MSSDPEPPSVLETIVASLPQIADHVAAMPDERKSVALDALEEHFQQAAMNLGYSEDPAQKWASALMAHVRHQIDSLSSEQPDTPGGIRFDQDYRFVERLLSRAVGLVALLFVSPMIAAIWIGLKLQGSEPPIRRRATKRGAAKFYSFTRGSGWVGRIVRRNKLQALPSLWHLVNGNVALRLKDFAAIVHAGS